MKMISRGAAGLIILLAGALADAGAKPPPAGISTGFVQTTTAAYNKQKVAMFQRNMSEAYLKVGERSPLWDAAAVQYLNHCAQYYVDSRKAASGQDLYFEGRALIKKGCQDPLVLCCHSISQIATGKYASAQRTLERSINKIMASKYPARMKQLAAEKYAAMLYRSLCPETERDYNKWRKAAADYLALALRDGSYRPDEQRFFIDALKYNLKTVFVNDHQYLYQTLMQTPNLDPWIQYMVKGICGFNEAWKSRGDGLAYSVTTEGWKGYYRGMAVASSNFIAAWEMHPERPEPAAYMILVEYADENHGVSRREWFDRAVAAQFDFCLAYEAYLDRLQPKWGGSEEELQKFGEDYLFSKRYDTDVPYRYFRMIELQNFNEWNKKITCPLTDYPWKDTQACDRIQQICAGYIRETNRPEKIEVYQSTAAATYWHSGEYEKGRRVLEQMTTPPVREILNEHGERYLYVLGGKYGARLLQAEQIAKTNREAAIAAFEDVLRENAGVTNMLYYMGSTPYKLGLQLPLLKRREYRIWRSGNSSQAIVIAPTQNAIKNSDFTAGKTNWYGPGDVVMDADSNAVLRVDLIDKEQFVYSPISIRPIPKELKASYRARLVTETATNEKYRINGAIVFEGTSSGNDWNLEGTNWIAGYSTCDSGKDNNFANCKMRFKIPAGHGSLLIDDVKAMVVPEPEDD